VTKLSTYVVYVWVWLALSIKSGLHRLADASSQSNISYINDCFGCGDYYSTSCLDLSLAVFGRIEL